jgi:hypothetical protein
MRVLITSSRMPFALGMARKLAAKGRELYAADDHLLSPENAEVPGGPLRLSLAAQRRLALSPSSSGSSRSPKRRVASPFRTLARLHDKGAFERLVRSPDFISRRMC